MRKFFNIPDRIKVILVCILLSIGVIFYIAYKIDKTIYSPNVIQTQYIYISTGSKFKDVLNLLKSSKALSEYKGFDWLAEKKNYITHIYPGKYLLKAGMNNNQLINILRTGSEIPVEISFDNIRTKKQLAELLSSQLEPGTAKFLKMLNDSAGLARYGFNKNNIMAMFIPNTYKFRWNISAGQFIDKMYKVYQQFWTDERKLKAKNIGLTLPEVSTLASIVQLETKRMEEAPIITGVYLNRLHKDMLLQSDPTVIYALGDFNIHRLLYSQLLVDSPYNTYKYKGLPPGPICLPNITVIDKVLNCEKTDYLFFCAKDDLSGYHVFAKTSAEHVKNASKYQKTLSNLNRTN